MTDFEQNAGGLLDKAAKQFRFYEDQHRNKIPDLQAKLEKAECDYDREGIEKLIADTYEKSKVNGALAHEIEIFLNTGEVI